MNEVTVIIPVYNAGRYLEESIRSVLNQTYPQWKMILVDDGSTDESAIICDQYAESDERIEVIHQRNQGSFSAVGSGLRKTDTEFVMFLDADDWYEPDMIETMVQAAGEYGADTVRCGYRKIYPDGHEEIPLPVETAIFEGTEIEDRILIPFFEEDANIYRRWSAARWDKIFRTDILQETYFKGNPKATIGEDLEMNLRYLAECRKAVSLDKHYMYCYRVMDSSLARGYSEKMRKQYEVLNQSIALIAADQNRPYASRNKYEDINLLIMLTELEHTKTISGTDRKIIRNQLESQIHDKKILLKKILNKNFPGKQVLQKVYWKLKNHS